MVLDFTKATFQQLLQIAYHEDCPNNYKMKAAFELQGRYEEKRKYLVSHYKNKAAYSGKTYRINS